MVKDWFETNGTQLGFCIRGGTLLGATPSKSESMLTHTIGARIIHVVVLYNAWHTEHRIEPRYDTNSRFRGLNQRAFM